MAECREAFKKIKEVLTSDLFTTQIVVACDASLYGIGACILHKMEDRSLKPIVNTSKTLLLAENKLFSDREGNTGNYFCCYQIP